MAQAQIAERADLLKNFVVREPQHQAERHVFDPDEL
jgi:hypothetical protein